MKTNQPIWKFVANLGDIDPLIDAKLVYVDTTGVYDPELVMFECRNSVGGKYPVFRFPLHRCSLRNNDWETISDNQYHADKRAWFADRLNEAANCFDLRVDELAKKLCANDPLERAHGYEALRFYYGTENFDAHPVYLTKTEIKKRYRAAFPRRARVNKKKDIILAPNL